MFPSSSLASRSQTLTSCSLFTSEPDWLSPTPSGIPNNPPPIPTRTVPGNPKLPEGRRGDSFHPRESTER